MAINYYANIGMIGSDIEMNQNELQLPVIDNEGTAPSTPVEGQMYFDTTAGDKTMYFYNGTAWIEMDGSGSGVEKIQATNGTFVEFNSGTNLVDAAGNVDFGTFDLVDNGGTPSATTFYRGDGQWATPGGAYTSWTLGATTGSDNEIADGDDVDFVGTTGISTSIATAGVKSTLTINNTGVTSIVAGTNISIDQSTGAVEISSTDTNTTSLGIANSGGTEQFKVTDTVDLQFAAAGGASVAFDNTNKRVTYTAPSNTNETYTLPVAAGGANSAVLNLTAGGSGSGIKSAVTINGTGSQIAISETAGNNGQVTVALPTDVTIGGLFTSGSISTGAIAGSVATLTGASLSGVIDMNSNQINELADGTLSGDAVNYGQLLSATSGNSEFQGGYNADTNTPDLDSSPATSIQQGYFWAVTDSGTFFAETVQPGDLIFANQDNPGATFGNWTVVQSGQEIAGEGASDGATTKGIAGFDSATFSVTANGFVTSDIYGGASTLGVVPSGGDNTKFLRGDGTWVVPTNTNTQRAAGTGLSLNGNTIDANVNATVQAVAKESVSTTADRTYEIQVDGSDQLVVNVPWADTNTNLVTSVAQGTSGTSTGLTNAIEVSPTTGAVKVIANKYNGGNNVGYVPNGGGATTFLRGDGAWVVPTDSTPVDSVAASTVNNRKGIAITPTTGNVVVGLNIIGQTNLASAPATDDELIIYDTSAATNKAVTIANLASAVQGNNGYATTITAWGGTITHSLGSFDVTVQLYDDTSKETIYAEIDRTGIDTIVVNGNGTFPSTNVRVLVSKVS